MVTDVVIDAEKHRAQLWFPLGKMLISRALRRAGKSGETRSDGRMKPLQSV